MLNKVISKLANRLGVEVVKINPMKTVVRKLENRGVNLGSMNALEVFGYFGTSHTTVYANKVSDLDVWEINPNCLFPLKENLRKANIKITNSYDELKKTTKKYDLVVIDNPMSIFADGLYCEHFEVFPDIFKVISNDSVVILNVIPKHTKKSKKIWKNTLKEDQLQRRKEFYNLESPENISKIQLKNYYERLFNNNGFNVEWSFFVKRTFIYYLAIKITKK